MFKVRAPNRTHSGISAGVRFTAGVGHTDNPAALAYFSRTGYAIELMPAGAVIETIPEPTPEPVADAVAPGQTSEPSPFDPGVPVTSAPLEKPIERMNKAELQVVATELGLDVEGTNREIVARIRAARA